MAATDCLAAGFYDDPVTTNERFLADYWKGRAWTTLPDPACTAVNCAFLSVSGSAPNTCMAIANWVPYRWNGATWTEQSTPSGFNFYSVSCPATNFCMAAGNAEAASALTQK